MFSAFRIHLNVEMEYGDYLALIGYWNLSWMWYDCLDCVWGCCCINTFMSTIFLTVLNKTKTAYKRFKSICYLFTNWKLSDISYSKVFIVKFAFQILKELLYKIVVNIVFNDFFVNRTTMDSNLCSPNNKPSLMVARVTTKLITTYPTILCGYRFPVGLENRWLICFAAYLMRYRP